MVALTTTDAELLIDEVLLAGQDLDIVIPNKYSSVDAVAFENQQIKSVSLPDELTSIDSRSFAGNELRSVSIPGRVLTIGSWAFYGNNLMFIELEDGINDIGPSSFRSNSLKKVDIPDSVSTIGEFAFFGNRLTSVNLGSEPHEISLESIANSVFRGNSLEAVVIPDSVITIGDHAFFANNLSEVEIPGKVTSIGTYAFYYNQLTSIKIPESVEIIDDSSFAYNDLIVVDIGDGVVSIGDSAFSHNDIIDLSIGKNVASIGDSAFLYNSIVSLDIGDSILEIKASAFRGNQLETIVFGKGLTSIGERAFYDNKLKSIDLPDNITSIGDHAFYDNDLESVELSEGLHSISDSAFYGNKLESLEIPNNITLIGEWAFFGNDLTSLDIPDSITSIGDWAFSDNQIASIELPNSITKINYSAFRNNQLTTIVIPDGATEIGESAFQDNRLTCVYIPNGVMKIGDSAFRGNQLTSIEIPKSVTTIGQNAFADNPNLEFISISSDEVFDPAVFPDGVHILYKRNVDLARTGLSVSSFDENLRPGSTVATFVPPDELCSSDYSYQLLADPINSDNSLFEIQDEMLNITKSTDYESKSNYSISVRISDSTGLTFDKKFLLSVANVNEHPTDLLLSVSSFDENLDHGSEVAILSSLDPDFDDTHTYSLVSGSGSDDNNAFKIEGNQLVFVDSPDFEVQSSYAIRLRSTDAQGLTFDKAFVLTVNDLEEGPPDINGDGLIDDSSTYVLWTVSGGVPLLSRRGRALSDGSSPMWDATKAVQTDSGFTILMRHERIAGRYKIWTADPEGTVDSMSKWQSGDQMMADGVEDLFDLDLNGDSIIGKPSIQDFDGDGFVDASSNYQVFTTDDRVVYLRNKVGNRIFSDQTSRQWDAVKVVIDNSSIQTLIEGTARKEGKYKIWTSSQSNGNLISQTRWKTGDALINEGYESMFNYDINDNGVIGV